MNTIKTKNLPSRTLTEIVGNDLNGNAGKQAGTSFGKVRLIASFQANLNTTSVQSITPNSTKFIISDIVMANSSKAITTADGGGFYHDALKGTTLIDIDTNQLTRLAIPDNFISLISGNLIWNTKIWVDNTFYFAVTTPEGSPATCDVYIYGYDIS